MKTDRLNLFEKNLVENLLELTYSWGNHERPMNALQTNDFNRNHLDRSSQSSSQSVATLTTATEAIEAGLSQTKSYSSIVADLNEFHHQSDGDNLSYEDPQTPSTNRLDADSDLINYQNNRTQQQPQKHQQTENLNFDLHHHQHERNNHHFCQNFLDADLNQLSYLLDDNMNMTNISSYNQLQKSMDLISPSTSSSSSKTSSTTSISSIPSNSISSSSCSSFRSFRKFPINQNNQLNHYRQLKMTQPTSTAIEQSMLIAPNKVGKNQEQPEQVSGKYCAKFSVKSSAHVSYIVGKQGSKIRQIRQETGTFIQTPVNGEDPVFVIRGDRDKVQQAKTKLEEAAQEFDFNVFVEACTYREGDKIRNNLFLPARYIGLVVGKKGSIIKKIMEISGTTIVTPKVNTLNGFKIHGSPGQIRQAIDLIKDHIHSTSNVLIDEIVQNQVEITLNIQEV
ncbi:transformation/transcription domain-associated protein [Sarcoptes scabiei]|nr:transformation/transcription domain-associated protein [Sarcoptes scabiei]